MLDWLQSLSLLSGTLVISFASILLTLVLDCWKKNIKWLAVLIMPVFLATIIYWLPVWYFGASPSEYWSWAPLAIGVWALSGMISSASVALFLKSKNRNTKRCK